MNDKIDISALMQTFNEALQAGDVLVAEQAIADMGERDNHFLRGAKIRLAIHRKDLDRAEELCRVAIKDFPKIPKFSGLLAQVLTKMRRFDEAELFYLKRLEQGGGSVHDYIGLARLAKSRGEWFRAARLWGQIRNQFRRKDCDQWWLEHTLSLLNSGSSLDAEQAGAPPEDGNENTLLRQAEIAYANEKLDLAWNYIQQRKQLYPDAKIAVQLEEALSLDAGSFEAAGQIVLSSKQATNVVGDAEPPPDFPPELQLPGPRNPGNDYGFISQSLRDYQNSGGVMHLPVSVILPTYNRARLLAKTLAGLVHQTYPSDLVEVIVADDGSKEDIAGVVRRFEDKLNISWVRQPDQGYRLAAVRNLGIRTAKHDHIVILDCDVIPHPGLVEAYMAYHHVTDQAALIGPRRHVDTSNVQLADILDAPASYLDLEDIKSENETLKDSNETTVDWRLTIFDETDGLKLDKLPYRVFSGGNVSLVKSMISEVGEFDEDFADWGGEDNEFGFRLFNAGYYFIPVLGAIGYHQEPPNGVNETDRLGGREKTSMHLLQKVPYVSRRKPFELYEVPKVSIYIPAFNAEKYIERSIDSALSQSFKDLEVVVCDDGSTDATVEILQRRYGNEPRVRWTSQLNNGIGAASNTAVKMCRAPLIGQLDSDDELLPDAVEAMVKVFVENPNLALAYSEFEYIDDVGKVYGLGPRSEYSREKLLVRMISFHFRMFSKRYWARTSGFDENLESAIDYDIAQKLSEVGDVMRVPKVCYRYRLHGHNISLQRRKKQEVNHLIVINNALQRMGLGEQWFAATSEKTNRRSVRLLRKV